MKMREFILKEVDLKRELIPVLFIIFTFVYEQRYNTSRESMRK